MFEIPITGGDIVDGTGAAGFKADVGISGDRVVADSFTTLPQHDGSTPGG